MLVLASLAGLLLACISGVATMLALPSFAGAAGTGAIAGQVEAYSATGSNLEIPNAQVCVLSTEPLTVKCAVANQFGEYEVTELPAGRYSVHFTGHVCTPECDQAKYGNQEIYAGQYYKNVVSVSEAQLVTVESGHTTSGVSAVLHKAASIAGTVSKFGGGAIQNVSVCATSGSPTWCAETNANGEYEIGGLPVGTGGYDVHFSGDVCSGAQGCSMRYISQYYDAQLSRALAKTIYLGEGQKKTEINATLEEGGTIKGTVTNASIDHPPVPGLEVCAIAAYTYETTCAETNARGEYQLGGLPSRDYEVWFGRTSCELGPQGGEVVFYPEPGAEAPGAPAALSFTALGCSTKFLEQYYDDASSAAGATKVSVTAPLTFLGIDASLQEASPLAPQNEATPTVSGTAGVGEVLDCSEGRWVNNPTRLQYAWLRDSTPIGGESSSSYTVRRVDEEAVIACVVTASNRTGSASATSNSVSVPREAPRGTTNPGGGTTNPAGTGTGGTTNAGGDTTNPGGTDNGARSATAGPGIAVVGARAQVRGGEVALTLTCMGSGSCKGELKLALSAGRSLKRHRIGAAKKLSLGPITFSIAGHGKKTIDVHLSAAVTRLLRKAGPHGVRAKVSGVGVEAGTIALRN
jgi:hypothetical protein